MERVSQAEFARRANVAKSTVTRWIDSGRLSPPGEDGRLDLDRAMRERTATESPLARDQARKAQFDAQKAARVGSRPTGKGRASGAPAGRQRGDKGTQAQDVAPSSEPAPDVERLGLGLKLETYKLQKAKAELANLELDQRAGLLVERTEVDYVLADFGGTLRALIEGLPARLAPVVEAHRGDLAALHKLIEDACREVLDQISEHMARRLATLDKPT